MNTNYYKKYRKYKLKYYAEKNNVLSGGDIDKNDVLRLIESIGFEFESADIIPFVDNELWGDIILEEKYLTDVEKYKKYYEEYDKKTLFIAIGAKLDLLEEINDKYKLEINFLSDTLDFYSKDSSEIYRVLHNLEYAMNNKSIDHNMCVANFLTHEDERINLSSYIQKDNGTLKLAHCEYKFTFTNLKKSSNIIKNTMNLCIDFLNEHFLKSKTIPVSLHATELEVTTHEYPEVTQSIKVIDDELISSNLKLYVTKENYYNERTEFKKPITYLVTGKNDTEANYEDAKWVPQMTFGVKLYNAEAVFLYLSTSNKQLHKMITEISKELNIILLKFKKYLAEKDIVIDKTILKNIKGFLFLISYNTNVLILLILDSLNNKKSVNFSNHTLYPFLIRHDTINLCKHMYNFFEKIIEHFFDFVYAICDGTIEHDDDEDFKKIYDKYFNFMHKIEELYSLPLEDCDQSLKYQIQNQHLKRQLLKSSNLFSHLKFIYVNFHNNETKNVSHFGYNLMGPALKRDYEIIDNIILVEDRFFIKDITKVFNKQVKLTLGELKKIIS